jgi:hypothetical protein
LSFSRRKSLNTATAVIYMAPVSSQLMTEDVEPDLKLEIAHILTVDVVAYSTLLISEQSQLTKELIRCVRSTPRFRQAEADGKLIRLPTGDGMALVFLNDPEAPIECAMQISGELKSHPEIRVRMGIHSGPINQVVDVNDRSNVTGAGIDMAQRVMDCGDAGHILLSMHVADDLAAYPRWNRHLHNLGECEVKHGRKISLVNFYTGEIGNPAIPAKLQKALDATKPGRAGASPQSSSYVGDRDSRCHARGHFSCRPRSLSCLSWISVPRRIRNTLVTESQSRLEICLHAFPTYSSSPALRRSSSKIRSWMFAKLAGVFMSPICLKEVSTALATGPGSTRTLSTPVMDTKSGRKPMIRTKRTFCRYKVMSQERWPWLCKSNCRRLRQNKSPGRRHRILKRTIFIFVDAIC